MKKQTIQLIFGLGLVILLSQHTAIAGSHRDAGDAKCWQNSPAPHQVNYRQGYVAVNAPLGAVINHLPRFNTVTYSRGQPNFVVGNTFYRRHNNGYVVVPNPAMGYRH